MKNIRMDMVFSHSSDVVTREIDGALIIVSNSMAFLKNVDRVFLLCENRLEAIGAHEDLMSQNPYYASLVIGAV